MAKRISGKETTTLVGDQYLGGWRMHH